VTTYSTAGPGTSRSAMPVARKTRYVESEGISVRRYTARPGGNSVLRRDI
jgi:hypothetical protein